MRPRPIQCELRIPEAADTYEAHLMIMGLATGHILYDVRVHPTALYTPLEMAELRYIHAEYGIPVWRLQKAIRLWTEKGGKERMRFPPGTPA